MLSPLCDPQIVEDPEDEKVLMDYEPPPSVRFESLHRPGLFLTIEEEGDELVLVARDKPSTALTDSAMAGTTSFMSLLTGGLVCSGVRLACSGQACWQQGLGMFRAGLLTARGPECCPGP